MKINANLIIRFIIIFCAFQAPHIFGQVRTIQPGDILEIVVTGNEALSQSVIVNSDGTVEYPALQGLPIDGITLQRLQEILVAQLSRYLETTPLIITRFGESYPIRVTVLGQVAMPGLYPIANTTTLQGAVSAAGGFIPGAQLSKIKLLRTVNQQKSEQLVNMEKFYLQGDPSVLPQLKEGDTIVVPGNPLATTVKVLGSVENPGSYDVFFQTSVLDAIFMAGGPTDDANLQKVKIISQTGQMPREVKIDIKHLLKAKSLANLPIIVPGDVIYIPKRIFTWRKFIGVMRDLSTFATLFYLISIANR